ncbi:MAG: protein translocase subunit SecF [Myxococcales bacterium]|nr:protein translocase subunit SecF [Myxococcales bacterium]
MQFFKPGTRYNIMGAYKPLVMGSLALVIASWALVATKGLNFGIDFAGGTEALVAFNESIDVGELRDTIATTGLETPEVVTYGLTDEGRYFIRSRTQSLLSQEERDRVKAEVFKKFGEPKLWDDSDETGEEIRVRFDGPKPEAELMAVLATAGFTEGAAVAKQTEGSNPVYLLRLPGVRSRIVSAMKAKYGAKFKSVDRLESVGSAVGKQMRNQGVLAVLYALIGILLYISFRFDLRYSPGAVAALIHDVSITIGIFSVTGMEFNLPIIAALLAIVGYSLNDTIVVYDRIRESLDEGVGDTLVETINLSISDTLSRTVLTSATTFLAVLAIYIFGGGIIQNFAFAMLIGVVVGTYSSIYIASPAVLGMDNYLKSRAQAA